MLGTMVLCPRLPARCRGPRRHLPRSRTWARARPRRVVGGAHGQLLHPAVRKEQSRADGNVSAGVSARLAAGLWSPLRGQETRERMFCACGARARVISRQRCLLELQRVAGPLSVADPINLRDQLHAVTAALCAERRGRPSWRGHRGSKPVCRGSALAQRVRRQLVNARVRVPTAEVVRVAFRFACAVPQGEGRVGDGAGRTCATDKRRAEAALRCRTRWGEARNAERGCASR